MDEKASSIIDHLCVDEASEKFHRKREDDRAVLLRRDRVESLQVSGVFSSSSQSLGGNMIDMYIFEFWTIQLEKITGSREMQSPYRLHIYATRCGKPALYLVNIQLCSGS